MHQVLDPPLGDTHLFDDLIGFVHQPLFFLSRVHHKVFGCLMWLSKELQMIEQWVFFVAEVHARSLLMLLLWLQHELFCSGVNLRLSSARRWQQWWSSIFSILLFGDLEIGVSEFLDNRAFVRVVDLVGRCPRYLVSKLSSLLTDIYTFCSLWPDLMVDSL